MAKIVEFIQTQELVGTGTEDNPHRRLHQLWSKDGHLIADYDPATDTARYEPENPEGITECRNLIIGNGSVIGSYAQLQARK